MYIMATRTISREVVWPCAVLLVFGFAVRPASGQNGLVEKLCSGVFNLFYDVQIPVGGSIKIEQKCTNGRRALSSLENLVDRIGDLSKGACTDVPTGVSIEYQQLSDFLGINDEDKGQVMALCTCSDKLVQYLAEGLGDIVEDAEVNKITSSAIDSLSGVLDCFLDSGVKPDTNKDDVIAREEAKGGIFIQGPEIGVRQYSNFLIAVGLCVSSSKCDDILTAFEEIFKNTVSQIGGKLVDALKTHYNDRFTSPFFSLFDEILEQKGRLDRAYEKCKSDIEAGASGAFEVIKGVRESFEVKMANIKKMIELVDETIDLIEEAIRFFEEAIEVLTKSYVDYLMDLLSHGSVPNLNSAVEFLAKGENIEKIKSNAGNIMAYAKTIDSDLSELSTAMGRLEQVLGDIEANAKDCFDDIETFQVSGRDILNRFVEKVNEILSDPMGKYYQCDLCEFVKTPCLRIFFSPLHTYMYCT